jgi:tripartite-type tricarboxylate transporter receptor subunit TctC
VATEAYPTRPIHLIVGFTAGATSDVIARIFAKASDPLLGQQVVVENKPGAGSSIAAEYVARSVKDGYTRFAPTPFRPLQTRSSIPTGPANSRAPISAPLPDRVSR